MSDELLRVASAGSGLLTVVGDIDASTAPILDSAMFDEVGGGATTLTLDMAGVSFVDSSGLRVLVRHHAELGKIAGALHVAQASPAVVQLLEFSGLTELLH